MLPHLSAFVIVMGPQWRRLVAPSCSCTPSLLLFSFFRHFKIFCFLNGAFKFICWAPQGDLSIFDTVPVDGIDLFTIVTSTAHALRTHTCCLEQTIPVCFSTRADELISFHFIAYIWRGLQKSNIHTCQSCSPARVPVPGKWQRR